MSVNVNQENFKKYKTTSMSCQCPDRKYRDGGSYTLKGQRVCKHIKHLREQRMARTTQENRHKLFPKPVSERMDHWGEASWKPVTPVEKKQYPIGMTTQQYQDLMLLKDTCQQFVETMQETQRWGRDRHHALVPVFVLTTSRKMEKLLEALN